MLRTSISPSFNEPLSSMQPGNSCPFIAYTATNLAGELIFFTDLYNSTPLVCEGDQTLVIPVMDDDVPYHWAGSFIDGQQLTSSPAPGIFPFPFASILEF